MKEIGQKKGRVSRTAARGANLQGTPRRHWNNRKYGASELRFSHGKEFVQKLCEIFAPPTPQKKSLRPVAEKV